MVPRSISKAFTLIELLVVIAIMAILAGFLMGGVRIVRQSAQGIRCQANVRQLIMGTLMYAGENEGVFPLARLAGGHAWYQDWDQALGRFMGLQWQAAGYWRGTVFACPSESIGYIGLGLGYAINSSLNDGTGARGWMNQNQILRPSAVIAFADGAAQGSENPYSAVGSHLFGGYDDDAPIGQCAYAIDWLNHRKGANLAMVDGHVELGRRDEVPSRFITMKREE